MKIFHNENGRTTIVWVQLQDLIHLITVSDIPILPSIFEKIFDGNIDSYNKKKFVKFTEDEEVDFFKKVNFIIDFNEYFNLTDSEFAEKSLELEEEVKEKMLELNGFSDEQKRKNANLFNQICNREYMIKSMDEIYLIKKGKIHYEFPQN